MKISVRAKTKARESKIEKIDETHFIISVKEPPIDNKANFAIIEILADYFNISFSQIRLISGVGAKEKIFELNK